MILCYVLLDERRNRRKELKNVSESKDSGQRKTKTSTVKQTHLKDTTNRREKHSIPSKRHHDDGPDMISILLKAKENVDEPQPKRMRGNEDLTNLDHED